MVAIVRTLLLVVGGIVLFALALPVLLIAGPIVIAWLVVRGVRGGRGRDRGRESQETRLIQETYEGLARMERRIDNLETILLEGRRARDRARHVP